MTARYFVEPRIAGTEASLVDAEAHHFAHVMRGKAGDVVTLFDGSGSEFTARVQKVGRSEVRLTVESQAIVDRESPREVTLCSALPRGDRQRWLVEKATELGVRRFVPLRSKRAVVQPDAGVCVKLRRTVIEAAKQCGRNVLMEVAEPATVAECATRFEGSLRLLAAPGAPESLSQLPAELRLASLPAAILIGPEGGFTDEEAAAAVAAGWRPVALGPRILRIETAAALFCAWAEL